MENTGKLIEAAQIIKAHCENTSVGDPCPLALGDVCEGEVGCIALNGFVPAGWRIKKACRWTENDALMAKALLVIGYVAAHSDGGFIVVQNENEGHWPAPKSMFTGLDSGETVNLSDIIAEYSEVTGHEV